MAYILTPRFAPAYQAPQCNPFGFCAPSSRPTYAYHTVQRPQPRPSPFASFFSQLDELVSEIDREGQRQAHIEAQAEAQREAQREAYRQRQAQIEAQVEAQRAAYRQRQALIEAHIEAQREAHRQRQLRERTLRAKFAVTQNEHGWQVDAEVPGFEQESISIEVTNENTLKIAGNTEWGAKPQAEAQPEIEATEEATPEKKMEGITLSSTEVDTNQSTTETTETESARPSTPDSDTASHRSYQATVEDDFEDLGPEASSLFSAPSSPATSSEPKGKEPAVEHREIVEDPEVSVPTETAVAQQSAPKAPAQQQQEEHPHSSFERTFSFPERIDASNVRASLKEGVLSISVPRAQHQVRRIAVL